MHFQYYLFNCMLRALCVTSYKTGRNQVQNWKNFKVYALDDAKRRDAAKDGRNHRDNLPYVRYCNTAYFPDVPGLRMIKFTNNYH
ncbi:hypothetical protein RCL_jg22947.t1 [Rhizophagus clarus]|uniref:Uncharacterized protein n=1 Tax=Rhizophagus clarus TaxID=94130 RepID=A0A8H3QHY0_9GLOM|nr:hypothetical protein RCL_jg22947.t1 [Rhizophagus clarus]